MGTGARQPRQVFARRNPPQREGCSRDSICPQTVIELREPRVLEEIAPPRGGEEGILGQGTAVHRGPGVIDQSGVQTGNKGAQQHLQIYESGKSDATIPRMTCVVL